MILRIVKNALQKEIVQPSDFQQGDDLVTPLVSCMDSKHRVTMVAQTLTVLSKEENLKSLIILNTKSLDTLLLHVTDQTISPSDECVF
jgi:hypothetical protein